MKQSTSWRAGTFLLRAALGLILLVTPCLPAADSAPVDLSSFTRQPYVQMATPESIVVVWRTLGPIKPIVRYGRSHQRLDMVMPAVNLTLRVMVPKPETEVSPELAVLREPLFQALPRLHSAEEGTVQYEARLTGLDPNTRYYYALFDGDRRLTPEDPSYTFATHPVLGQSRKARFWVVGDSGTAQQASFDVHDAMIRRVQLDRRPLDFYLHMGDMAYNDGKDREFQAGFFNAYEPTLRHTVCWPTMGNHEGHTSRGREGIGPYYDAYVVPTRGEAGGLPSGTEAYYSFDYGRIHFICLDSHDLDRQPTGAMARWLKADLDRTRQDWIVAFWHHPPYTKGSHDSDTESQLREMREYIMPILESGGVDLVLTGHSHIYERSMLVDGAYATPTVAENTVLDDGDGDPLGDGPYRKSKGIHPHEGAVQLVAGHGGANLSRRGTMPIMKRVILEHGSVIVDMDDDSLTGIMVNKDGFERDRFSIVKQGRVEITRLSNPRQLPAYVRPERGNRNRGDRSESLPEDAVPVIEKNADWAYLAGSHPASTNWTLLDFVPTPAWKAGRAPFGYDDSRQHTTDLKGMRNQYTVVYLRRFFEIPNLDGVSALGLVIDYDDAFIAYLNGVEVVRRGVRSGRGAEVSSVPSHSADGHRYFPFGNFKELLRPGRNVLAIEGHNRSLDSSDFTLDPYLIMQD